MTALLDIRGLTVSLPEFRERPLIRDVDVCIPRGTIVGLVGESGSGKSMTARAVLGLLPSGACASGEIMLDGCDLLTAGPSERRRLRLSKIGVIFQDPRVHIDPFWKIGSYLTEGLRVYDNLDHDVATGRARELLESLMVADPDRVLMSYPHELSGGMLQRVMIAGALAGDPDLLIADEATTAIDVTLQAEVLAILDDLRASRGLSVLFITHDLELAAVIADRMAVMYAGRLVEIQSTQGLFSRPAHPYSAALSAARPDPNRRRSRLPAIAGRPISGLEAPVSCPFEPRCQFAVEQCRTLPARLIEVEPGTSSACLRVGEVRARLASESWGRA